MLSPRVRIFTICYKLKFVRFSKNVIIHSLRLTPAFNGVIWPIKVGQIKVTKKPNDAVFGILFTDSQSSERLFSSSSRGL